MIKIRYCGSTPDNSGYGDANRADIASLFLAGGDVSVEAESQTIAKVPTGWVGELCQSLENRDIDYKIKIVHLTPDCYPRYLEEGKYHVGRLMWETNLLPPEWIAPCNKMEEIWTATKEQAEVIKNSGVKVPIYVFPEAVDISLAEKQMEEFVIPNFTGTVFYSIFQWIERKDPHSLLTTYWKTFEGVDDVVLILKTYRVTYSEADFKKIKDDITRWKNSLKLKNYPKVLLVQELFDGRKLWQLHKTGGVLISTSRGEGWNRPAVEASLLGNPVISIDRTGFADIFPKDIFYPVTCAEAPVITQSWIPWYQKEQVWFNINTQDLSRTMMQVYKDQEEVRLRGTKAQNWVKDNLSYHKVGQAMIERLEEISKFI